jgi:hypothetical protein
MAHVTTSVFPKGHFDTPISTNNKICIHAEKTIFPTFAISFVAISVLHFRHASSVMRLTRKCATGKCHLNISIDVSQHCNRTQQNALDPDWNAI